MIGNIEKSQSIQEKLVNIRLRQSKQNPALIGFSPENVWYGSMELADCNNSLRDDNGDVARRFVACWNTCEGIPTEILEIPCVDSRTLQIDRLRVLSHRLDAAREWCDRLEKQRDELLAALGLMRDLHERSCEDVEGCPYECHGDNCEDCLPVRAQKAADDILAKIRSGK